MKFNAAKTAEMIKQCDALFTQWSDLQDKEFDKTYGITFSQFKPSAECKRLKKRRKS